MRAVVLALLFSLVTIPAIASDGVLEINQTCAVQTGCFSGDVAGFPVTISTSGSYLSRPPRQLTHSDLEIPSGFGRYAARLTSMPRLSARFSAGVIQSSASCGRTSL